MQIPWTWTNENNELLAENKIYKYKPGKKEEDWLRLSVRAENKENGHRHWHMAGDEQQCMSRPRNMYCLLCGTDIRTALVWNVSPLSLPLLGMRFIRQLWNLEYFECLKASRSYCCSVLLLGRGFQNISCHHNRAHVCHVASVVWFT